MIRMSLHFNDEIDHWIDEMAHCYGVSKEQFVVGELRDKLQDDRDYLAAVQSIVESRGQPKISRWAMMEKYGKVAANTYKSD